MTTPALSPWVEQLNALGVTVDGARHLVSLDADELLDTARASTGLDDFGAGEWSERYAVLMRSLEEESYLHLVGRLLARHDALRCLRNRLLLTDHWARHPEVLAEPVTAPVFIVGSARTGTTFLHEALAGDPATRAPATWELLHPVESLGDESWRAPADASVRLLHSIAPEYASMHTSAGDLPNECIFISMNEFFGDAWGGNHTVPTYDAFMGGASPVELYQFHRRFLQTLQQRLPSRRWVLKSPLHLGRLAALFATYPDARIIQTHRDPLCTIPSTLSLVATLKAMRCEAFDVGRMAPFLAMGVAHGYESQLALRASGEYPDDQFIDVLYADIAADPMGTVERIYEFLGWDLTPEGRAGIQARIDQPSQHTGGGHHYSLADFGLDADVERAKVAAYQAHFNVPNEV